MISVRRVVGQSMLPAFSPGTIVLGLTWLRPRVGSVVVAERDGRELIKRVAKISPKGFYLLGDNTERSTDSRKYGWFSASSVKSVIIGSIKL